MLVASSIKIKPFEPISFSYADKIVHAVEYAIWAMLFILMLKQENRISSFAKVIPALLISGGTLAILDEIHQSFIPGRKCDFFDFIADLIGIAIVAFVAYLIYKHKQKNYIKKQRLENIRN
ncbi:MAG: VanZ family protein [Candidatus Cloacimonetes bacterium]|nr:VanZ family protein [Candidatus Cloacimonadota bacterium]